MSGIGTWMPRGPWPAVVEWSALAVALLLAPVPSPERHRLRVLRAAGRLAPSPSAPSRSGWPARVRARWPATRHMSAVGPRLAWAGPPAAALGVATAGGVALGVAAGVLVATALRVSTVALRRRRDDRIRHGLLAAVRMLAAELEAGTAAGQALPVAGLVVPAWSQVFGAAGARGEDVDRVLLDGARTGPAAGRDHVVALAHAWRVSDRTGAPLAEVLVRLAGDLAEAERRRRAVAAALAGPRSSMLLLAGLPVVGLALGLAMGARPFHVLLSTPLGRGLCCAGVVLDALGVLWTQRITSRAET